MAPVLLPHLAARAMVMKRYPHGITGEFFFMKRETASYCTFDQIETEGTSTRALLTDGG